MEKECSTDPVRHPTICNHKGKNDMQHIIEDYLHQCMLFWSIVCTAWVTTVIMTVSHTNGIDRDYKSLQLKQKVKLLWAYPSQWDYHNGRVT